MINNIVANVSAASYEYISFLSIEILCTYLLDYIVYIYLLQILRWQAIMYSRDVRVSVLDNETLDGMRKE